MFFFTNRGLAWFFVIFGLGLAAFCLYGILSGKVVKARDDGIKLALGGAAMAVLGAACLWHSRRNR